MHYSFEKLHLLKNVTSWKKVNLALITYWGKDKIEQILIVLAHKNAGACFRFFCGNNNYNTQYGLFWDFTSQLYWYCSFI